MITAAIPTSEAFRLIDLSSYDILDTQPETDFDELVELAAQICDCPISLISLLDKDRQWFKSKKGVDVNETSRDVAFCSHAILKDEVMVVEDTLEDIRFHDNPFVTGDLRVRFYAGAPILSDAGNKLGTICIIDNQPRKLSVKEERALIILSNQVTRLLELRKKNMIIRERAEEIIDIKSKAIRKVLTAQENEKKAIAINMHEDLAQGVASSIFYLSTAETDSKQSRKLISTAKIQLQDILIGLQNLSTSITPHLVDLIPAKQLVADYAKKTASAYPFTVTIKTAGNESAGTPDNAICSIRIIEQWLQILSEKRSVQDVYITVQSGDAFELLIEDNGICESTEVFEQQIFESLVYERAQSHTGTVEVFVSPGKNLLKVVLPLSPALNTQLPG